MTTDGGAAFPVRRSKSLPIDDVIAGLCERLKASSIRGMWSGKVMTPYFNSCRHRLAFLGVSANLTRDTGYHTGGWWKNPDYERCFHLSLAFFDPTYLEPRAKDQKLTDMIVRGVFGEDRKLLWCEPPYSPDGKLMDVWHYRLFCDEGWNAIKPRSEVYEKELTEAGWKSFSDVQAAMLAERTRREEKGGE